MASETALGTSVLTLATESAQFFKGLDEAEKRNDKLKTSFEKTGKSAQGAGTDMAGLGKQLTSSGGATNMLTGAVSKLGPALLAAVSVTAVKAAISSYTEFTSKIADLSAKTGIGAEALQRLKYAAEQNGASLEQVTGAVTKLGSNLAGGNKNAVGALEALGLSLQQIRSMESDKAFTSIADAIAKVPDPMDRSKLAMDLFGKSGAELLPMMRGNLTETAAAADRLGIVMSEEAVQAGDAFGDSIDSLIAVGKALIGQVLTPMIPVLTTVAELLAEYLPKAVSLVKDVFIGFFKAGWQVGIALQELVISVVELGAKVPWLGEKLGATSENLAGMRANVAMARTMLANFGQETDKTSTSVSSAGKTLQALKLDYDENAKATKAAGDAQEKYARIVDASLERVRYQHVRVGEAALAASQNISGFTVRMSEAVAINRDFSTAAMDTQVKLDGFGHVLQTNLMPSLQGIGGELTQNQLRLAATGTAFGDAAKTASEHMNSLQSNVANNLRMMLEGTQSFSDGWRNIWAGIKSAALGFLSDTLNGMLKSLTSSQAGFTSSFQGMFSGFSGVLSGMGGKLSSWIGSAQGAIAGIASKLAGLFGGGGSAAAGAAGVGGSIALAATTAGIGLAGVGIYKGIKALMGQKEHMAINDMRDKWFDGRGVQDVGNQLAEKGIDGETARQMIERVFNANKKKEDFISAAGDIDKVLQGFASGTHGQFVDFGAGTPVMLHGRERVMTENEGRRGEGNIIKIFMDGQMVARAAVPYIPGEVNVLVGA